MKLDDLASAARPVTQAPHIPRHANEPSIATISTEQKILLKISHKLSQNPKTHVNILAEDLLKQPAGYLSKREQQIMELVYQRERITAAEAMALLPGTPSNSTARTLLRILEEKGHLKHVEEEGKYVYVPVHPRQSAAREAIDGLVKTFFRGSVSDVVATLISEEGSKMSGEELDRLQRMIEQAREEGR